MSKTAIYSRWQAMVSRCHNENDIGYMYYGEKGIGVYNEWKNDFTVFYKWALNNGFKENLTLDRIDATKNYCPDNCRWITMHENILNQERNSNRNKDDLYIHERHSNCFVVDVSKGTKQNRKLLYRESFLTKKEAAIARDLFLKTGEKTRHIKHELGTSEKEDISGHIKRKERAKKRQEQRLIALSQNNQTKKVAIRNINKKESQIAVFFGIPKPTAANWSKAKDWRGEFYKKLEKIYAQHLADMAKDM